MTNRQIDNQANRKTNNLKKNLKKKNEIQAIRDKKTGTKHSYNSSTTREDDNTLKKTNQVKVGPLINQIFPNR